MWVRIKWSDIKKDRENGVVKNQRCYESKGYKIIKKKKNKKK